MTLHVPTKHYLRILTAFIMTNYRKFNNIAGWLCFLAASFVYISTIEPTASFWDCGEFIATSYKLEVGHQPGAPLFLMMGKVFSLFAGGNVEKVPVMINIMSALMSAGAIMFLFWTITHFVRKIVVKEGEITQAQQIMILGSGFIGALAYTFTDSFWFSAVEGEVYATSAFFTAVVFWAMLKWEECADEKHSVRWIILIAYLMGLSIGVHLLNLLTIPALAFIYYFRRYKTTGWGIVAASAVGMGVLLFVQYGVVPGIVVIASWFEKFFVNTLHFGFGSGVLFYAVLAIAGLTYAVIFTHKKKKPLWNTVTLCLIFIIIGYSSFAQLVVRSDADTPMDEGDPQNVFSLLSYLGREQYGDRPLVYGPYYNAKYIGSEAGSESYYPDAVSKTYKSGGHKDIPKYDPNDCTVFPRMFSTNGSHIKIYKEWEAIKSDRKPTFGENLDFFFSYQIGFMYWRYFMWNFAGRQNDIQGEAAGGPLNGNWISGINFYDSWRLGPQDKLMYNTEHNKGRNKFYLLPMILGFIGLYYHFKKHWRDSLVVMLLFVITGIAIVVYLNQNPMQPRERDYAYAGSFYAFAIWIGLGTLAVIDLLKKRMKEIQAGIIGTVVCASVPFVLVKDGWDDHDRSGRFTARDFAYDYLMSCAPNAILFTNGDNDTFPLWYAQEVENIRTDVRVVNLSLFNTDWYVNQMRRKAYESDVLPISIPLEKYVADERNYIPFVDHKFKDAMELKDLVKFVCSEDPDAKVKTNAGVSLNFIPVKKFKLTIDSATVVDNGTVPKELAGKIAKTMEWEIEHAYITKADLIILDMLATNNWKRPMYFAITVGSDSYMNLESYFQLEGLAYRIVPVKNDPNPDQQYGRILTNAMYDNLMNKYHWGGMKNPKVYLDENILRMTMNMRNNFARLAEQLLQEGKKDSAVKVLNKSLEEMPEVTVPFNIFLLRYPDLYYRAGDIAKGDELIKRLTEIYASDLNVMLQMKGENARKVERQQQQSAAVLQELKKYANQNHRDSLAKIIDAHLMDSYQQFNTRKK